MISPAKLDKLPAEVVNLVQELQEDIISDICRRVSKANYLTPTAEWQLYKANQLNLSYQEVNRRIARKLKVRDRTVQELYTDTVKQALKEDADIYRIAAAMGKLPGNTGAKIDKYFRSASFSQLLSKGLKNSKGQLRNLCNSMAAQANRQLSDAMDLAHLKVISGAFSYNDAIYAAVKSLADKGITRIEYPSGRKDNADVCVRRAVLSSVNKSCCDIQLDLAREVGSRYVEVTSHFGARPSHAEWQGQIYCLERGDPKYPYFYEATGYGTGEGLGGWNCRHNFFPYFEGIDTPYHTPEFSKTENNEYYAMTQKQRGYERAVRDSKRQLAALDGARKSAEDPALRAKLDKDFARRAVTLKNREARLEKFIKDNDLQRDNSRVRVVSFGKSTSLKAVAAAKKQTISSAYIVQKLDNGGGSGIIKSNEYRSNHYTENAVTNKSIRSVPYVAIDGLSKRECRALQKAHKELLKSVRELPIGTEASATFNMNMQPLGDIIIGTHGAGRVRIEKHNVPYIGIHSHPDNQTLSYEDLQHYLVNPHMQVLTAIGNNGSFYALQKFENSDIDGFGKFLDETFENADCDGLTFKQFCDKSTDLSNVNKDKILSELLRCMNTVLERADDYGFKYYRRAPKRA